MDNTAVTFGVNTALRANVFTRAGYTFVGWTAYRTAKNQWYYTDGTTNGWYTEGSQPSGYEKYIYNDQQKVAKTSDVDGDIVIMNAQWSANSYTVTFVDEDGTVLQTGQVAAGTIPTAPAAPTKAGSGCTVYTFAGWDREVVSVTGDATYTATYTESTSHSFVNATCTAPKTCTACGATEGTAPGHSYKGTTTLATCTADGKTVYTCSACGDSYTEVLAALGHSYGAMTTPASCPTDGKTVYTCSICGDGYVEVIAAAGHSYQSVITPATCTTDGKVFNSCAVCGVYESNGVTYNTGVIAYSLAAYCLDRIAKGSETMKTFAAETVVYGYYAKDYFENLT